ncbi:MAG: iron hydrogenase small subunit, partial [Bacillota bacterium]
PIGTTMKTRAERAEALYQVDRNMSIRRSHKNPAVTKLYEEFLEHPQSELAHTLLHTQYTPR